MILVYVCVCCFFKQKTAYEMRISDWSSDVCSSDLSPICSTVLPGGERCQIVIPSVTPSGCPSFTIRKPSTVTLPIDQLAGAGLFRMTRASAKGLTDVDARLVALRDAGDWPEFFKVAVPARKNILVSGAPGSGKETLAKALISSEERRWRERGGQNV